MSIPSSIRPIMARMSAVVTHFQGTYPTKAIVHAGYSAAQKTRNHPLWDGVIDKEIHESLHGSALKVARSSFRLTYTDQPTPSGLHQDEHNTFWVKKDCTPSSGVRSFLEGPTTTDCGGALKGLSLQAIGDVLGEEKFNALVSHKESTLNFSKGARSVPNPLDFFNLPAYTHFHSSDLSHITLGTRVYFQGIPWYGIKHPIGTAHGHWAVYLDNTTTGKRLYWALGFDKLVTETELLEDLLSQYNTSQSEESKQWQRKFPTKEAFLEFMKKVHSVKLQGYDAEIDRCFDEPNIVMSKEEAIGYGLGFFGYSQTDRVSSTALRMLREMSLPDIQDPLTPITLGIYHISVLARQLLSTPPEDPAISKTTPQAQNFLKWVGEKA